MFTPQPNIDGSFYGCCSYKMDGKVKLLDIYRLIKKYRKGKPKPPLLFSYFPDTTSLTRHIYMKSPPKIKEAIKNNEEINWKDIWTKIQNANKIIT